MDLSNAEMSNPNGPARIAMHAVEGFGKTTLAAHLPGPLFIGAESGIPRDLGFDVPVVKPREWLDLFSVIGDLERSNHKFQSVILDTVDWIEPLIHRFCCDRDSERQTEMNPKSRKIVSIEDYGWGKGYIVAEEEFRKLITALDRMQQVRGLNVMMLMHSQVRTFKNPAGPDFDRYEPKCQQRIARVIVEWCETMLFGYFQVDSSKISDDVQRNEKTARAKGIGSGTRIIGSRQSAMYDAKNRVGLPPEFELGETFDDLIASLLGENVPMNGRRSELREVKVDRWADDQRNAQGEQARRDARDQQDREDRDARGDTALDIKRGQGEREERGSVRDEQEGPQKAPPRDDRRKEASSPAEQRTESRTWTEPKKPDQETRTQDGVPVGGSKPTGKNVYTDGERRDRRLKNAIASATKDSKEYGARVGGWANRANNDPHKIDAIIQAVEKELKIEITA